MGSGYRIRLVAKNEGLEYQDGFGEYRFNVSLDQKEWTVKLPPSKGESLAPHELSAEEQSRILPRITAYLSRIRWFGLFPVSYIVRFAQEPYVEFYRGRL